MNVGQAGSLANAVYASTNTKTQLDTLTQQVSDGLVSDSYAGLARRRRPR